MDTAAEVAARPGQRALSPNWLLAAVGFAVFLGAMDQMVVVTLLEPIMNGVHVPLDQFYRAAWVINGYILGYVVAMPLMGRISDIYGHSRIFLLALFVFLVGSLWVSACQSLNMLIVARAVQAIGGGALVPVSMAIVADYVPPERRAVGLGFLGAAAEGGGLFGPLWGGSMVQLLGWRGHFWINVPLCLPVIVIVLLFMARSGERRAEKTSVDYVGGLLLAGALTCLAVALTDDPVHGRPVVVNVVLYVLAVVFGASFFLRERLAKVPMIMLSLFRSRPFAAGNLTHLLMGGTLIVAMVDVPVFTIIVLKGSYFEGGLNLMRLTVMLPVGAVLGGFLAGWLGFHRTTALGMFISGVGFFLMTFWTENVHDPQFTLNLLLTGLGFGLVHVRLPAHDLVLGGGGRGDERRDVGLVEVLVLDLDVRPGLSQGLQVRTGEASGCGGRTARTGFNVQDSHRMLLSGWFILGTENAAGCPCCVCAMLLRVPCRPIARGWG